MKQILAITVTIFIFVIAIVLIWLFYYSGVLVMTIPVGLKPSQFHGFPGSGLLLTMLGFMCWILIAIVGVAIYLLYDYILKQIK